MARLDIKNFPDELYRELKREAEEKGYNSLSQYVIDILEKRHLQSLCYESIEVKAKLGFYHHKFEPRNCALCGKKIEKGNLIAVIHQDKYNIYLCGKCGLNLLEKLVEVKRIDTNITQLVKKEVEHEIRVRELEIKINVLKKEYDFYVILGLIEKTIGELLRITHIINQKIMSVENQELRELLRDIDKKLGDIYIVLNAIKDKIKAKVEKSRKSKSKKESKKKEKKEEKEEKPWISIDNRKERVSSDGTRWVYDEESGIWKTWG